MRNIFALLALTVALPASAASLPVGGGYGAIDSIRDIDAVGLGERFCAARISGDMSGLADYIAPKLVALLSDEPADAVPWQSYATRPATCTVSVVNGFANTVGVLLELTYTAPGQSWSDMLNIQRTPDSWLINNVFYEGGGNLRFRLFEH